MLGRIDVIKVNATEITQDGLVFVEAFSKDNMGSANWAEGSLEDVEYITKRGLVIN